MEDIEGILRSVMDEANKKTTGESKPAPVPSADSMSSEMKAMMTDIQDAMADSKTRDEASVVRTKADIDKVDFFTDIMVNSGNDLAAAQQKIKLQADIGALEVQENAKRVRDAAGGLDFQVKQIAALTESQQNTNNLQAELADILDDEFTGVGLLDDAINMFRVGGLYGEIDQSQRKSAVTANQIQQLTQSQESFGRVNTQAASTVNQGTIAAGQTVLAAQASIDEAKAKLNQVFSNGEAYARLEVASGQEVKNLIRQFEVMNSLESLAVRNEEMNLRKQEIQANKELLEFRVPAAKLAAEQGQVNLRITKLTEQRAIVEATKEPKEAERLDRQIAKEKNEAILLQNKVDSIPDINRAREAALKSAETSLAIMEQTVGANPLKVAEARLRFQNLQIESNDLMVRREAMAAKVRTGQALAGIAIEPESAVIMQGINRGGVTGKQYDLLMEIADTGVIALDPATARSNLAQLGTFKPTKATRFLEEVTIIQNNLGATDATYSKPNTAEGAAAEYNATARAHYKSKEINIATGDNSNPLHAPNFAVLSKKRSVSGTALYQNVLKEKGMTETNPQIIVDAAMAGVLAKKISPSEALAGIEAIFDAAAVDNDSLDGGLARVGFDNQTTYNVRLPIPETGFFKDYSVIST